MRLDAGTLNKNHQKLEVVENGCRFWRSYAHIQSVDGRVGAKVVFRFSDWVLWPVNILESFFFHLADLFQAGVILGLGLVEGGQPGFDDLHRHRL